MLFETDLAINKEFSLQKLIILFSLRLHYRNPNLPEFQLFITGILSLSMSQG